MGFVEEVAKRLDLPPRQKSDVLQELREHYTDIREELAGSGMSESQMDAEVQSRLGSPQEVAARLSAVHNIASWESALLAAAPFAASAIFILLGSPRLALARVVLGAVLGVVAAGFSLVQIVHGMRPLWLPTWLAMAFMLVPGLLARFLVEGGHEERTLSNNGMIVLFAGLGLVTLLAVWRIPRWRWWVIGLAAASISPMILLPRLGTTSWGSAPWYVLSFLGAATLPALIAMPVFFARGVFEKAPFGNAMHASLFLLALFTLACPSDSTLSGAGVWAVSKLLCGAAVIWAARESHTVSKPRAISAAVGLWAFGNALSGRSSGLQLSRPAEYGHLGLPEVMAIIAGLFLAALIPWLIVSYLVLYPIRREEYAREAAPPFVMD